MSRKKSLWHLYWGSNTDETDRVVKCPLTCRKKKKTLNLQRQVLNLLPKGLISSGSVMVSKAAGLLIVKSKFVYKISQKKS